MSAADAVRASMPLFGVPRPLVVTLKSATYLSPQSIHVCPPWSSCVDRSHLFLTPEGKLAAMIPKGCSACTQATFARLFRPLSLQHLHGAGAAVVAELIPRHQQKQQNGPHIHHRHVMMRLPQVPPVCSCRPGCYPPFLSEHNIKVVLKNLVETESALKYSLVVCKSLQRNQMSQLTKMPQIVTNAITIFTKSRTLTPLGPKLQSKAKTW